MSVWTPNFDCNEEFGSRVEQWDTDNPSARVTVICDMDERYLIMADIVGSYRVYPFSTPVPLRATSARIMLDKACKMPDTTTQSKYQSGYKARIELNYSFVKGKYYEQIQTINWSKALYAEEDMEPSMQFLTDDYHKYGWGKTKATDLTDYPYIYPGKDDLDKPDGALKQGEETGKAFYQVAVTRVVKGYEALPTGYAPLYNEDGVFQYYEEVPFHQWPGTVHNVEYTSELLGDLLDKTMNFPAGTLLFTQPKVVYGPGILKYSLIGPGISYMPFGPTWSITAKLLYQEQGWNSFYRPKCEEGKAVEDPYYVMLHKACKTTVEGQEGQTAEYPKHLPYQYLDISEFLFNSATFPPTNWPPDVGPPE